MSRVCIVTPDLAGPTRNGGVGTHCLHLARFLARRGDDVSIVHTGPPDDADRDRWRKIYRDEYRAALLFLNELPEEPREPVMLPSPRHTTAHRVYRWLRAQDFAAIHFQDWQGNGAICARAKHTGRAFADTLITVTTHGSSEWIREGMGEFPSGGRESMIDDALERTAVELADVVIHPSRHMHEWLKSHGWRLPARVEFAPYLFPANPSRASGALARGALREIVFFGRLETRKGLLPFLDALELLAADSNMPPLRLTFLGKHHLTSRGASADVLSEFAKKHATRYPIEVLADRDHAEALALLAAREGALVVTPSLADNAPFAVIECLVHGFPLLASDRGGIPELVGDAAHLVAPEAGAMANRLREVAKTGLTAPRAAYSPEQAELRWTELLAHKATPRARSAAPSVSVVIPHFNQPEQLAETLAALAAQTRAPREVIVVDDGSTAREVGAHLDKLNTAYAARGWKILRAAHAGPSAARNAGARAAAGDALVFVDADNPPRPDFLEALGDALAASGADIVTCAFQAVSAENPDEPPRYLFCPLGPFAALAMTENTLGDTSCIVRREVFLDGGGFDTNNRAASEDWQFFLSAIRAGRTLAVVPDPLFDYRIAASSHARQHTELESAIAALHALPVAERDATTALAMAARGASAHLQAVNHQLSASLSRIGAVEFELHTIHQRLFSSLERAESLQRELTALKTHAAAQEDLVERTNRELILAREHAANLQNLVDTWHNQAREFERRWREADRNWQETKARLDQLARVHQQTTQDLAVRSEFATALEIRLRMREDKIARMQDSLSWKITAPFRAIRRAFARKDTGTPHTVAKPSAPTALVVDSPAASGLAFCIDEPATLSDLQVRRFSVRGWVLRDDDSPIVALRARSGETTFPGRTGLRRPDVFASFPRRPQAQSAGFAIEVRLDGQSGQLALEAQTSDGVWTVFLEMPWTCAPDATETPPNPYDIWTRKHENRAEAALQELRKAAAGWKNPPVISVVMPVYNTPEKWLARAIESVRAQTYAHWELCIADDASTAAHVRPLLERAAQDDARVKVAFREKNGHISAASNSALALATGTWIALLDHDDELAPNALHEIAATILARPDTDLVYSDEDKIDEHGHRFQPYFKPDFLPDLLIGQNFVSHLAAYRASIVREIGGFREGFEGSQDWDLLLRFVARTTPGRIQHIAKILYHWRAIPGSTALLLGEKSYPVEAARRALAEHFERIGEPVSLVAVPGGHWRVRRPRPEPAPLVSLIIPTRNRLELVRRCVESILERTSYPNFEILIVDNHSDDPATLAWLAEIENPKTRSTSTEPTTEPGGKIETSKPVRVLRYEGAFNFSAINNHAVGHARGSIVGLLNNDLETIHDDWLDEMVSHVVRAEIGCVGAMLYFPHDAIQHAGVVLGIGGVAGHAFKGFPRGSEGIFNRARLVQNYSAVTAACLLVRKSVYEQVGGLDERELAVAFNDIDFCLKVRGAGYRNLWTPFAELYHHESASRGAEDTPEKHERFRREIEAMKRRWGDVLLHDPAYNPNLTLEHEDFSIDVSRP